MRASFAILIGLLAAAPAAYARTFYLSPSGSDDNPGTNPDRPWLTFSHAFAALAPGDTLNLLDGTYAAERSGLPFAYNAFGHNSGTAEHPIVVRAVHERAAFIDGDGSADTFRLYGLAWWIIEGLRIQTRDNANSAYGSGLHLWTSDHAVVRRCLFAGANRFANNHTVVVQVSAGDLFEENEFYDFFRSGIDLDQATWSTFRRNYFNSRNTPDLPGGYPSIDPDRGDIAISNYPGSNNVFENNISENDATGFTTQALGPAEGNRYLGNIAIGGAFGFVTKSRESGGDWWEPYDELFENDLALDVATVAFYGRDCNTIRWRNNSAIGATFGFIADHENGASATGPRINEFTNDLALDARSIGFYVKDQTSDSSRVEFCDAYGSTSPFLVLPPATASHNRTDSPELGACRIYIPPESPMHGAGLGGADIGANVVYRYQDGMLTDVPLWDPQTGEFTGCGAIVSGVNDRDGWRCGDVHQRLNVNWGGCSLPGPSLVPPVSPDSPAAPMGRGLRMTVTPNPFRSSVAISLAASVRPARLGVVDAGGREVASLGSLPAGSGTVRWDGRSASGEDLPPGVYFICVRPGHSVARSAIVKLR